MSVDVALQVRPRHEALVADVAAEVESAHMPHLVLFVPRLAAERFGADRAIKCVSCVPLVVQEVLKQTNKTQTFFLSTTINVFLLLIGPNSKF